MPTSSVIHLKNVRLSFAHLFKAKIPKGETDVSKAKFQATFLLNPENASNAKQIEEIEALSAAIEKDAWPKGPGKMKGRCWTQNGDDDVYDGWENQFSIATSESVKPKVVSAKGVPLSEGDAGAPYSGCYVDAWISLWTQDNTHGKRVNANLIAVQFRKDGEAFSSRPSADSIDFDDLSGQEEDDDEAF